MPNFAYSGRTRAGQTVTGERAADTMDAAVAALKQAASRPQLERRVPITPTVAHGRASITATDRT